VSDPRFRILLIEDNAADVYLIRKALEGAKLQFDLTVIPDGSQAIALVGRMERSEDSANPLPHLVLMDLNLPKNGGVEVLHAMRQSNVFSTVPVVIASSSSSPHEKALVQALGISRYLEKPPDLDDFLNLGFVLKTILEENPAG